MMDPLVSVIVPSNGHPSAVIDSMRSVLAQSLKNIEILLVECGDDETVAESVRSVGGARVRGVPCAAPESRAERMNALVAAARAPWVAFLEPGDRWMPHHLWSCVSWLESVGGDAVAMLPVALGGVLAPLTPTSTHPAMLDAGTFLLDNPIHPSGAVCRRSLAARVGGFPTSLDGTGDWAFWLRVSTVTTVALHDRVTVWAARSVDRDSAFPQAAAVRFGFFRSYLGWLKTHPAPREARGLAPEQMARGSADVAATA